MKSGDGREGRSSATTAGAFGKLQPAVAATRQRRGDAAAPAPEPVPRRAFRRSLGWPGGRRVAVAPLRAGGRSLLQENPTIDEVVHLPAGVTYWQKHTFRLYHHNPPLVKLVAALPVVCSGVLTEPLYESSMEVDRPGPGDVCSSFRGNQRRTILRALSARPADHAALFRARRTWSFSLWSRRLYGNWGGLLSLSLWVFCPNVLLMGG